MNLKTFVKGALATTMMMSMLSLGAFAQSSSSSGDESKPNAQQSSAKLSSADRQFVTKAAQGGMAEVELGQLAAQKAQNPQVKEFGQKMVDDHSKANDQLKQIASQEGVTLPTGLDAKDQALKDKLSKLSGDQFDRMYMQHMVQDHKKDVADFQKEANSGKDQQVKQFAQQTLPTLKEHLQMAQQDAHAAMKGGNSKGSTSASNQQQ